MFLKFYVLSCSHWWRFLLWHSLCPGTLRHPSMPVLLPPLCELLLIYAYGCSFISFFSKLLFPQVPPHPSVLVTPHITFGQNTQFLLASKLKLPLLYDFQICISRSQLWIDISNFWLTIFNKISMSTSNSTGPKLNSSISPKPLKKNSLS